jgi:hypothetical protein
MYASISAIIVVPVENMAGDHCYRLVSPGRISTIPYRYPTSAVVVVRIVAGSYWKRRRRCYLTLPMGGGPSKNIDASVLNATPYALHVSSTMRAIDVEIFVSSAIG